MKKIVNILQMISTIFKKKPLWNNLYESSYPAWKVYWRIRHQTGYMGERLKTCNLQKFTEYDQQEALNNLSLQFFPILGKFDVTIGLKDEYFLLQTADK